MNIFNLPDLGEGLPEAEIHEWFVKEGDWVNADQPMVSMETAKAVVDVPCPQSGTISKCFGKPGDIIKTGAPLVAFVEKKSSSDKGTVVGKLEESAEIIEDHFKIGSSHSSRPKTTPAVRLFAKKMGVDLSLLVGTGEHGVITREDVQKKAHGNAAIPEGYELLHGVRRAMLQSMTQSHQEVVPVTVFDEVHIQHWNPDTDITLQVIRAITHAAHKEPALNAWFNTKHSARKLFNHVHLGLAMDSEDGLFVPVIKDVERLSDAELRAEIDELKIAVSKRTLPKEKFQGATITLSNFGKFSGKFASPIIIPPTVAILAVGRMYEIKSDDKHYIKVLPLSLSFDHRAVTGGEATRFLGEIMSALQKGSSRNHH